MLTKVKLMINSPYFVRPLTKMEFNAGDIKLEDNIGASSEGCMACLVAVGRVQPSIRFAIDDAIHRGRHVVEGVEFVAR